MNDKRVIIVLFLLPSLKYLWQSVFSHLSVLFAEHGNFRFKRGRINHCVGPLWVNDIWISSLCQENRCEPAFHAFLPCFTWWDCRWSVCHYSSHSSSIRLKILPLSYDILHYRHCHDWYLSTARYRNSSLNRSYPLKPNVLPSCIRILISDFPKSFHSHIPAVTYPLMPHQPTVAVIFVLTAKSLRVYYLGDDLRRLDTPNTGNALEIFYLFKSLTASNDLFSIFLPAFFHLL